MNTLLNTTSLVISLGTLILLVIVLIYLIKRIYNRRQYTASSLSERHKNDPLIDRIKYRTKYPEVNVFQWRETFSLTGMALAVLMSILVFNWGQFNVKEQFKKTQIELEPDITIEIPRTRDIPQTPPPPPPTTTSLIVDVHEKSTAIEPTIKSKPSLVPLELDTNINTYTPAVKKTTAPPPPVPPPVPAPEDIFDVVEDMPRYPGCEDEDSKAKKSMCSQKRLLKYINSKINYPQLAKDNGVEGTTIVSFIVDQEGKVKNAKILVDIGAGCGAEALRVVKLMANEKVWIPGKQRGRPVSVRFNLPVKFNLQ